MTEDHERQVEAAERELADMEERSERVGEQIDETRKDWDAKVADPSVPGAGGDPEATTARTTRRRAPATTCRRPIRTRPTSELDARGGTDPAGVGRHRADPRRAGMLPGEQRDRLVGGVLRHDGDEAAAHVEDVPHLGLGHLAVRADQVEHRRHGQRRLDREADVAGEPQQVRQPAAGDVREAVDGQPGAQQLEHRAHVDDGRLEQHVGDRRARQRRRAGGRGRAARARGGRACSRWSAARSRAARSARRPARTRAPVTIRSSATVPKHAAVRSKPVGDGWPRISSGSTATSPPGISTPACSAPALSPRAIAAKTPGSVCSTAR